MFAGVVTRDIICLLSPRQPLHSPSLARLRDLSWLAQPRQRVLELLPAHRHHVVPGLARRHDDAQLVRRRGEVVIRLVTERNLVRSSNRQHKSTPLRHEKEGDQEREGDQKLTTCARTVSPGLKLS